MSPRVGFVGVGRMGRPMVDRMIAAELSVEVFVRRRSVRSEIDALGIPVASSAVELARRSEILIVCLFDDTQLRELLLDGGVLSAMPRGGVLVSHVTGSPNLSTRLQQAAGPDVTVLDVPISGSAEHIHRGQLTLLVGGAADALERARPALAAYGDPVLHVGGLGDGQRTKLLNNLLFAVNLRAALETARLGRTLGIEPDDLARIVSECSGASYALDLLRRGDPEQLAKGVRRYLAKDVAAVRGVADEVGIDLGELGELASWVEVE